MGVLAARASEEGPRTKNSQETELSKGATFVETHRSKKSVAFCLKKWTNSGSQPRVHQVHVVFFDLLLVLAGLAAQGFTALTSSWREKGEREGEKGHPKKWEKTHITTRRKRLIFFFGDCLKHFRASFRGWRTRALLPDASGCLGHCLFGSPPRAPTAGPNFSCLIFEN